MEVIYRKRGRGKTIKLLQECIKLNRIPNNLTYILVSDRKRAIWLNDYAKRKGYLIPFPISVPEISSCKMQGISIKNLLVDDVEDVLKAFAGNIFNIPMMTLTKKE